MRRRALLLLGAVAGCTAAQPAPPADPAESPKERGSAKGCDAQRARAMVGRMRSEAAAAEAQRLSGAAVLRWVPMGAMVTMDYRPDRLNIRLDKSGRILSLDCG